MRQKAILYILIISLCGSISQAFGQDTAALKMELAVTAYNYAVGCDRAGKYSDALEGLSHIPEGYLSLFYQRMADSLRYKCEILTGTKSASTEIPLKASESLALDDQSELFMSGIHHYETADYATAFSLFDEVIELGDGPYSQVLPEAMFWKGLCLYQEGKWNECCATLIKYNDTKGEATHPDVLAMSYYTMGYARMKEQKWHQARLNFERFVDAAPADVAVTILVDGKQRLQESRTLEKKGKGDIRQPLTLQDIPTHLGEYNAIEEALQLVADEEKKEQRLAAEAAIRLQDWHAPYILEE